METVLISKAELQDLIVTSVSACLRVHLKDIGQPAPEVDQLLSVSQAATFLKLAKQTVYALVARNEIPYSKPGSRLYFSKAELTEWIKAGRNTTLAETAAAADKFLSTKARR